MIELQMSTPTLERTESDDNAESHVDTNTTDAPKLRISVFPKCPKLNENVDFELGEGFIVDEERRVQNADLDAENDIAGKRIRRKPSGFVVKPASNTAFFADACGGYGRNMVRGAQKVAGAIVLCMCMHCLFIRNGRSAMAKPALLADYIVLPKNYEHAMTGLYAKFWKKACNIESGALARFNVFDTKTPCPGNR